jgi:hypothetical protein
LEDVVWGSTDVEVKEAPGRPLEYGETFPGQKMSTGNCPKLRDLQGTAAFGFTGTVETEAADLGLDSGCATVTGAALEMEADGIP